MSRYNQAPFANAMLTLIGIVTLLVFIYVRPHEMSERLDRLPVLYGLFGLTAVGFLADARARLRFGPQMNLALAFLAWCSISLAINSSGFQGTVKSVIALVMPVLLFSLIACCVGTFSRIAVTATTIAVCCSLLAAVGAHQSRAPRGCVEYSAQGGADRSGTTADGRSCESRIQCYEGSNKPDSEYTCEHIGLLGTTSFRGRARYRGILNDPNEFALALCCGLPLLFALAAIRRTFFWKAFTALTCAATLVAVAATQSRTGVLGMLAVIGVFAVYRYKAWGVFAIGVAAVGGFVLGGRSDGSAAASVYERYDAWHVAMELLFDHPLLGVGHNGFGKYHFLTAHNSYLLIAAEVGFIGLFLFTSLLYLSLKIPIVALRDIADTPATAVARTWSLALIASLIALMTGMMFLSLSYHPVIWVYLGLAAALHATIQSKAPSFRVNFGLPDVGAVIAIDIGLLVMFRVFLRIKGL